MPKSKNLLRRGGRFYGRVALPKRLRELRHAMGLPDRREVTRSLQTPDRRVAERLLPSFLDQCYREFEREEEKLRAQGAKPLKAPTATDMAEIRRQFFRDTLQDDELERTLRKTPREVEKARDELRQRLAANPPKDAWELLRVPAHVEFGFGGDQAKTSIERRLILKNELRAHLVQSDDALVANVVEAYCHAKGLVFDRESFEYKRLARDLVKEWLNALEVAERRDQGVYDAEHDAEEGTVEPSASSAQAKVVNLADARAKHPRRGEHLKDYFDSYLKERKSKLREKDRQVLRATLRQFIECNGDKAVTEYGRSDMSAFKRELKKYPTNAAKIYPGLSFEKVLKSNLVDVNPTLNSNTVRSKLSTMSSFGKWLEDNVDGVDASNFSTSLPPRDDRERMEPFTDEEVAKILSSHAFVGCESDRNYSKPGAFRLRDWHFWFTLIAAFTGARTNEIMQMEVTDLREEKGVLVFELSDEGEGKSLKTKGSKRLVPVHPTLVELGLIAYRDGLVAGGATSLFEGAPEDEDGRRSTRASKWFRKFLGKIGVKGKGDRGGAHRWRHTLTDALRRAGIDEYDIALVLGHKVDIARMTGKYGREMSMQIGKRRDLLSKAEYPTVDFSLLIP